MLITKEEQDMTDQMVASTERGQQSPMSHQSLDIPKIDELVLSAGVREQQQQQCQLYAVNNGLDSSGYQESMSKIMATLKEKSNAQELMMAELFQRILNFEKQIECLKVTLFRQPEIKGRKDIDLFNIVFKQIDLNLQCGLRALDLKEFIESHLPNLLSYPDRFYNLLIQTFSGVAYKSVMGWHAPENEHNIREGQLSFADFLMLIWPKNRFKYLTKDLLFLNKFPIYDSESYRQHQALDECQDFTKLDASIATMNLVAEVIANYLQFYMERELILKELLKFGFDTETLFDQIKMCSTQRDSSVYGSNRILEERKSQAPSSDRDEESAGVSMLFSFILQLPIILSTFDTEIIISAIVLDKRRREFKLRDLMKFFPIHEIKVKWNYQRNQSLGGEDVNVERRLTIVNEARDHEEETRLFEGRPTLLSVKSSNSQVLQEGVKSQHNHSQSLEDELKSISIQNEEERRRSINSPDDQSPEIIERSQKKTSSQLGFNDERYRHNEKAGQFVNQDICHLRGFQRREQNSDLHHDENSKRIKNFSKNKGLQYKFQNTQTSIAINQGSLGRNPRSTSNQKFLTEKFKNSSLKQSLTRNQSNPSSQSKQRRTRSKLDVRSNSHGTNTCSVVLRNPKTFSKTSTQNNMHPKETREQGTSPLRVKNLSTQAIQAADKSELKSSENEINQTTNHQYQLVDQLVTPKTQNSRNPKFNVNLFESLGWTESKAYSKMDQTTQQKPALEVPANYLRNSASKNQNNLSARVNTNTYQVDAFNVSRVPNRDPPIHKDNQKQFKSQVLINFQKQQLNKYLNQRTFIQNEISGPLPLRRPKSSVPHAVNGQQNPLKAKPSDPVVSKLVKHIPTNLRQMPHLLNQKQTSPIMHFNSVDNIQEQRDAKNKTVGLHKSIIDARKRIKDKNFQEKMSSFTQNLRNPLTIEQQIRKHAKLQEAVKFQYDEMVGDYGQAALKKINKQTKSRSFNQVRKKRRSFSSAKEWSGQNVLKEWKQKSRSLNLLALKPQNSFVTKRIKLRYAPYLIQDQVINRTRESKQKTISHDELHLVEDDPINIVLGTRLQNRTMSLNSTFTNHSANDFRKSSRNGPRQSRSENAFSQKACFRVKVHPKLQESQGLPAQTCAKPIPQICRIPSKQNQLLQQLQTISAKSKSVSSGKSQTLQSQNNLRSANSLFYKPETSFQAKANHGLQTGLDPTQSTTNLPQMMTHPSMSSRVTPEKAENSCIPIAGFNKPTPLKSKQEMIDEIRALRQANKLLSEREQEQRRRLLLLLKGNTKVVNQDLNRVVSTPGMRTEMEQQNIDDSKWVSERKEKWNEEQKVYDQYVDRSLQGRSSAVEQYSVNPYDQPTGTNFIPLRSNKVVRETPVANQRSQSSQPQLSNQRRENHAYMQNCKVQRHNTEISADHPIVSRRLEARSSNNYSEPLLFNQNEQYNNYRVQIENKNKQIQTQTLEVNHHSTLAHDTLMTSYIPLRSTPHQQNQISTQYFPSANKDVNQNYLSRDSSIVQTPSLGTSPKRLSLQVPDELSTNGKINKQSLSNEKAALKSIEKCEHYESQREQESRSIQENCDEVVDTSNIHIEKQTLGQQRRTSESFKAPSDEQLAQVATFQNDSTFDALPDHHKHVMASTFSPITNHSPSLEAKLQASQAPMTAKLDVQKYHVPVFQTLRSNHPASYQLPRITSQLYSPMNPTISSVSKKPKSYKSGMSAMEETSMSVKFCEGRSRCSASRSNNRRDLTRLNGSVKSRTNNSRSRSTRGQGPKTLTELKESIKRLQRPTFSSFMSKAKVRRNEMIQQLASEKRSKLLCRTRKRSGSRANRCVRNLDYERGSNQDREEVVTNLQVSSHDHHSLLFEDI